MIYGFDESQTTTEAELAVLAKDVRVRVLNCSAAGCLVETAGPIPVGTLATLRITLGGREFADYVRVVRCQAIEGAGSVYHVGAEFLSTAPPFAESFRYVIRHESGELARWLAARDGQ